ncbi:hypothetical protein D6855_08520 [Butyrivibrio sp. CB08]|uniref:hypothetical protein n=1 Tax=Butyrivibrio sp. CB08 TaxID=2364879 RepID=UPI000EAA523E|nr:hypothetical protein [Butyrivibrio sp. CB08]RKM59821.1 hypothetical protein D6855_08520 [Butyrivibrio sp. CB08]
MEKKTKALNFIASAVLTLLVLALVAFFGDFYFDLNDDVLMKDILSGAYTGVPEGHNIQMLYPISAFIALFYRVYRGLDWYGIFLCLCQFGCVFIMLQRVLTRCEDKIVRIAGAAAVFLFMLGGILSHFAFVQYTFTCGFLSATAAFLIMTHEGDEKGDHILAILLIVIAYLLRSEMLLLTLPIVGVGILIRFCLSRIPLSNYYSDGIQVSRYGEKKSLFKKYVILCLGIVLGLVVSTVAHNIAYSPAGWKEFNALFDARTELYDFQYIPDYDENAEFYETIALSKPEQQLLINYNYGIDDEVNTSILRQVASYADKLKTDEVPLPTRLIQSIPFYLYRLRHIAYQKSYEYPMTDAPLNLIAGILYLGTAVIFLFSKDKKKRLPAILLIALLFACRSSLWLYIIVRGRDPIRITHPLYIMESVVLLGMILTEYKNNKRFAIATLIASAIAAAAFVPNQINVITGEMAERDKMRAHYDALYEYFDEHPESFYFVDVYTGVSATDGDEKSFSEKMFVNVDNSLSNHDLMGGWACKSPLYYKKIAGAGFTSMHDAIIHGDNVYVVSKTVNEVNWLKDYYLDKGQEVEIEKTDLVSDVFVIYRVRPVS